MVLGGGEALIVHTNICSRIVLFASGRHCELDSLGAGTSELSMPDL